MHHSSDKLRLLQEVAFETTSLLSEGYHVICDHHWKDLIYTKTKHLHNGNVIDIFAYPRENKYVMKKNGKLIKERKL